MNHWTELQKLNEKLYAKHDAESVWAAVLECALSLLPADAGVWIWDVSLTEFAVNNPVDTSQQRLMTKLAESQSPEIIAVDGLPKVIVVPVAQSGWIGWLVLESERGLFDASALDTAVYLCGAAKLSVADLTRYAELEKLTPAQPHELQQRLAGMESLQRVTRELTSTIELNYILSVVLDEVLSFSKAVIGNAVAGNALAGFVITFELGNEVNLRAFQGYTEADLDYLRSLLAELPKHPLLDFILEQNQVYIGDTTTFNLAAAFAPHAPALLVSPVFYAERLSAAIIIQAETAESFTPTFVEFVERIGVQSSIAVGNSQRYQEQVQRGQLMHRRAEQMSRLLEVSRTMRSERQLADILLDVAYAVQEGSGFDIVLISVREGDQLRRVAGAGMPLVELEKRKQIKISWSHVESLCQERFRIGQCYYLPEEHKSLYEGLDVYVPDQAASQAQPGEWQPGDLFFVPLRGGNDEIVGIMSVGNPRDGRAPTPSVAEVIEIFASQVALAIENNRLVDNLRRQVSTLQLFNELSRSIATKLDLPLVLNTVVQSVTNLLEYDYATIFLQNAGSQSFTPLATSGYTLDLLQDKDNVDRASMINIVVNRGMPLVIEDTSTDQRYVPGPVAVGSSVLLPLMVEGRSVGILAADRKARGDFSPADVATLTALADQVAVAVENARLFEEVKRFNDELELRVAERTQELAEALEGLRLQRDRSEVLYHIASELVASLDMDRVLSQTLSMLQRAVRATRSSVILLDNNTGQLFYRAAIGHTEPISHGGRLAPLNREQGIVGWVLQNRQAVIIADAREDPRCDFDPELNIASLIAVPILGGTREALGVILLQSRLLGVFDDPQLRLVEAAAVQIGNALNNAELYRLIREQAARMGSMLRQQQIEAVKSGAILEGIADGVMVADAEGKITLFNAAAERILSITKNQALGRFQDDILGLYGSDAREWLARIEYWKKHPGDSGSDAYFAQRLEVGRRFVSVHLSPVVSSSKEFLGVVAVFRDITSEIEADRAKSDFVSTVSHELRTPMTSIVGYVDLIMKGVVGPVSEMQMSFLNKIQVNADRLTDLVNDLLDISRIEEGRIELQMEPVSMEELIQQVTELVTPTIVEKDQILDTVVPGELPPVYGDPARLRQILTNLIGNAYKYTPVGGKITVYAYVREGMVHVAVADTGIGIAPENQKRIFERFYRVEDDPAVYEVSGTGLGLAITLSLIQMHGGSISLESELGEGSTFTFSVPLAQGGSADDLGEMPPELYTSSSPTILIVEDDIEVLHMLQVSLEAEGFKILTATSGVEGLRIAREKLPDLISLDIRLPDLDGYEVLQLLKRGADTADIPVFIVSVVSDRQRGLGLGAMDYLIKPIDEGRLLEIVHRALSSRGTIIAAHRDREILLHLRSALQARGFAVRTTMRGDRALRLSRELAPAVIAFDWGLLDIDGRKFLEQLKLDQRTRDVPVMVMVDQEHETDVAELGESVQLIESSFDPAKLAEEITNLVSDAENREE
ncbi:MAG: GAF domain-containing protein [Anaerolineae bacterium]|nr:GAF domain-containing protein [Anaerolineae bacterium]